MSPGDRNGPRTWPIVAEAYALSPDLSHLPSSRWELLVLVYYQFQSTALARGPFATAESSKSV